MLFKSVKKKFYWLSYMHYACVICWRNFFRTGTIKLPFDRLLIIECNQSLKEAPFGTLTRAGGRWFERPAAFHNSICVRFALSDWLSASIMNGAGQCVCVLRLAAPPPRWMVLALFAAGWFPSSDLLRVWSLTGDALNQKTALINPFARP